jgi:hypothetical protein
LQRDRPLQPSVSPFPRRSRTRGAISEAWAHRDRAPAPGPVARGGFHRSAGTALDGRHVSQGAAANHAAGRRRLPAPGGIPAVHAQGSRDHRRRVHRLGLDASSRAEPGRSLLRPEHGDTLGHAGLDGGAAPQPGPRQGLHGEPAPRADRPRPRASRPACSPTSESTWRQRPWRLRTSGLRGRKLRSRRSSSRRDGLRRCRSRTRRSTDAPPTHARFGRPTREAVRALVERPVYSTRRNPKNTPFGQ